MFELQLHGSSAIDSRKRRRFFAGLQAGRTPCPSPAEFGLAN